MEWYNTQKVLEKYNDRVQQLMEANLADTTIGQNSSFILEYGDSVWEITFHTLDYYKYIESGRRAGSKMPPVSAIQAWIEKKHITPRPIGGRVPSLPQLAFLIARHIGRDGIPAKPYLQDIKSNVLEGNEFNTELSNALTQDIVQDVDEFFSPVWSTNTEL